MNYITVSEASQKWNIGSRRICILCKEGRIRGAVKKSRVWMIPANAQKPEDGRKVEVRKGINPLLLIFNPSFFEGKDLEPTEDEKRICMIQEKFLKGQMREALTDVNKCLANCSDIYCESVFDFLKFIITADLGTTEIFLETREKMRSRLNTCEELEVHRMLTDYFWNESESFNSRAYGDERFDELMPLIGMITIKKTINEILKDRKPANVTALEMICRECEKSDYLLITAYCHLYLAVYYNVSGENDIFNMHFKKALDILLPRKWYVPIAEYSATIDLSIISQIDSKAYAAICNLSGTILNSFVQIGIFNELFDQPRMKRNLNVQIGYKLVQDKSVETIANELGISQYMVKRHIEDLYAVTGTTSKKEIKAFVIKNIMV